MKKILFFLLLTSSIAQAQVQSIYKVATIAAMKTYFGTANRVHVVATNQDYVICTSCTADEILVFAGAAGRKWKKALEPNYLSAKDFGATGDGTTNDRAALQAAADAAYTLGRPLYIPTGVYYCTTTAIDGIYANLFLKPGAVIFGDGDKTIIKRNPSTLIGYAITYNKTVHNAASLADRNYTIKNLKILGSTGRGYETPGTTENDGGIFLAAATNRTNKVLIEGVTVEDVNKEAIAVWDAVECTMINNKIRNTNHDAFNPQIIGNLLLRGNYTDGVNFAVEYDGEQTGGVPTYALIEGNEFSNTYEYGIAVEAGDYVKVSNNIISGQTGSTSVTGTSIGVYLVPNQAAIGILEISGNKINNFIHGGIDNGPAYTGDYVTSHLIIKGNTISNPGQNAIRLHPYSTAKILKTEISDNTLVNWNRIDNGNSFQWSAMDIEVIDAVSIRNNRIYNITNGKRNDPLYLNNATNVTFINNDCTGPVSEFYSTLEIRQSGTNTGFVTYMNKGLTSKTGVDATPTDASDDPVSSNGTFDALALKSPLASPTFTGTVVLPSTTSIGTITNTELSYVDGVTSAIQTQLGTKAGSGANTDITSVLLNQTGLVVKGASSNALTIKPNETLSAGRTLNIVTGDANRTLTFTGDASITGTNTGDQTTVSGNAGTATALQNTRTIWGQNFDGTANVTGNITLSTSSITMTGSIGATGARVTKGWFTDGEFTNMPTVGGTSIQTTIDAKVADAINDGTTTIAPSQNAVFDALALKANIASPALTGTPTAPTAAVGTNTTQIATTEFALANSFFTMVALAAPLNPADGATYYFSTIAHTSTPVTTATAREYIVPMNCTLVGYTIVAWTGASSPTTETSTAYMRINNTTDVTLSSAIVFPSTALTGNTYYAMNLSTNLNAGDKWTAKWLCPTWVTNPTAAHLTITFFFKAR